MLACFASALQAASSDKRERFYGARACRLVVEPRLELCLRKTLAIAIHARQIAFALQVCTAKSASAIGKDSRYDTPLIQNLRHRQNYI